MSWEAIILSLGLFGGFIVGCFSLAWFIFSQFSNNRKLLYEAIKEVTSTILAKLEYHERHDDERFIALAEVDRQTSDRIWNIELRNAAKDGVLPHEYKKN